MTDELLQRYAVNVKNLHVRANKVIDYRKKHEKFRMSALKELKKAFASLDEKKCEEITHELEAHTVEVARSVDTFSKVLVHHVKIARQILPTLPKDEYTKHTEDLLNYYMYVVKQLDENYQRFIVPQITSIEQLHDSLSLRSFKEYERLYEKEKELFETLHHDAEIRSATVARNFRKLKKAIDKVNEWKEDHPRTIAFAEITASIAVIITGMGVTFGIFRMMRAGIEKTQLGYDMINWATDLLGTI